MQVRPKSRNEKSGVCSHVHVRLKIQNEQAFRTLTATELCAVTYIQTDFFPSRNSSSKN